MGKLVGHAFLGACILLTVYGQLIFKWQADKLDPFPQLWGERALYCLKLLLNPWILSTFAAAFIASFCWLGALKQLELSYAYPWTSLCFVLVMFGSALFFAEALTTGKLVGVGLIVAGVLVIAQQGGGGA